MTASALVVRIPFGSYNRGDRITNPALIANILAGENASYVIPTGSGSTPVSGDNSPSRLETTPADVGP